MVKECKTKYQIVAKGDKVWDETDYKDVAENRLKELKKEYGGQGLGFKIKKCKC